MEPNLVAPMLYPGEMEPVEVGDFVHVHHRKRPFEVVARTWRGYVLSINEVDRTMLIRPYNPYRRAAGVIVEFIEIKAWRGECGDKWLNPTTRARKKLVCQS